MFIGEIRVGEGSTLIDVVFDTGSDWLVIGDSECSNCNGNTYNTTQSKMTSDQLSSRTYGSASLTGRTFEDKICLTSSRSSCVDAFEYFAFVQQTGINSPIEGILGMSQNK